MISFASLKPGDRVTWFQQFAIQNNIHEIIVEKDFWVVWTLGRLFSLQLLAPNIVFKGGTSLSKVYHAISRFSEDIDISINPAVLGYEESALDNARSKNQRAQLFKKLETACNEFVNTTVLPALTEDINAQLGKCSQGEWLKFEIDASSNSPILWFNYPHSIDSTLSYIRKAIKLEFGSLTDQQPTGKYCIKPMIAEMAGSYSDFEATVVALEIERTFWEKATILHSEFHRPSDNKIRDRFARHYSDFAALWNHERGRQARNRCDILAQVAQHKSRFFSSSFSNYDTATLGTLRLSPPEYRVGELATDYANMRSMFIGNQPPTFDIILEIIHEAETELNNVT